MTMMSHRVVRLTGQEDWEAWGEDWADHVDLVAGVTVAPGAWLSAPEWLRTNSHRWLDWGTVLWEVSKAEVLRLVSPMASTEVEDLAAVLQDDQAYGVIWVEEY